MSAAAAVLVLGVVGPAHAQEDAPPTGTGTSAFTIVPTSLDIEGLPVEVDATLGALVADATNTADPVARLALTSIGAAGQNAPDLAITSSDGDRSGSEQRSVDAGGVGATVGLVDYAVSSTADSAVAGLSALAAELTTPLGLGADVGAQGLGVVASPTETAGEVVVSITGLELGLGDLLPADVLAELPLGVAIDLLRSLDVPLPAGVGDLDALVSTVEQALTEGALLPDDLADLDDLPGVGDALDALDAASADLTAATTAAASLESTLDGVLDGVLTPPADLQAQVETLAQQVEDATTALDVARAELDAALEAAGLGDLLDSLGLVDGLLDGLDLEGLLTDLLGTIADVPLLSLGSIDLVLDTVASGTGSVGTITCAASGLQVLGSAVPTPGCDAVGNAIETLDGTLGEALRTLPLVGALPAVTAGGLVADSSGTGAPDADGVSTAFARISALTLDVDPVQLDGVVDELTAGLLGDLGAIDGLLGELDGILSELDSLLGGLDTVVTQLEGTLTTLDGVLSQLVDGGLLDGIGDGGIGGILDDVTGGIGLFAASTQNVPTAFLTLPLGLDAAVGQILAVLDTLPTGAALDGLDTLGLSAVVGAVEMSSTFTTAAAAGPASPGTPGTPAAPGSLPNTGGEAHRMFLAALAALAAGGVTLVLGRSSALELLSAPAGGRHDR